MCVCNVCVTHTQKPTHLLPLVFLSHCLPNKQPTKFQRFHPRKQQQPLGNACPGGRGGWAGLQLPPAPLLQPAGQGASLAPVALPAGRAGMFTTSYRWPACRLQ